MCPVEIGVSNIRRISRSKRGHSEGTVGSLERKRGQERPEMRGRESRRSDLLAALL
jgi:hypothetical protein